MSRRALALGFLFACAGAYGDAAAASGYQRISDVDYAGDGIDAHRLDLYLPADRSAAAILLFVHGGAFLGGDRRENANVGRALAAEGLATVIPSYRLFPQSDAEGAVEDVARAASWVVRHARDYGLNPRNLFLAGHSAGAQIVAVIGTNPKYLAAWGVPLGAIRGVFAVAGAYDVRDLTGEPESWLKLDYDIYGQTPQARQRFSPLVSIDRNTPPTVTACGTADDPWSCDRATGFAAALRAAGIRAQTVREYGADHMGMLRGLIDPKDPLNAALLYFVRNLEEP